jgi:hypothetical protein
VSSDEKPSWLPKTGVAFQIEPITHESLKPYATAIGESALAWNALQDEMAAMFWMLLGQDKGLEALAVWNVVENDRLQRKMLRELARITLLEKGECDAKQKQKMDDVEWLLKKADKLSGSRNDIVHSPLLSLTDVTDDKSSAVSPLTLNRNPRAIELSKKDLMSEIHWCRDTATVLLTYCRSLKFRVIYGANPWPARPQLPNRVGENHYLCQALVTPSK